MDNAELFAQMKARNNAQDALLKTNKALEEVKRKIEQLKQSGQ